MPAVLTEEGTLLALLGQRYEVAPPGHHCRSRAQLSSDT